LGKVEKIYTTINNTYLELRERMLMLYAVYFNKLFHCKGPTTLSKGAMIGLSTCNNENGITMCVRKEKGLKIGYLLWCQTDEVVSLRIYIYLTFI
jgi:hypothetical protein